MCAYLSKRKAGWIGIAICIAEFIEQRRIAVRRRWELLWKNTYILSLMFGARPLCAFRSPHKYFYFKPAVRQNLQSIRAIICFCLILYILYYYIISYISLIFCLLSLRWTADLLLQRVSSCKWKCTYCRAFTAVADWHYVHASWF